MSLASINLSTIETSHVIMENPCSGAGESSFGNVLATQILGPEFDSQVGG